MCPILQEYPKKQKSSYYDDPIQQTIRLSQLSWGACMSICDDNKFCTGADHNHKTSICILDIDTSHPSYQHMYQRCSHIPSSNGEPHTKMIDGK